MLPQFKKALLLTGPANAGLEKLLIDIEERHNHVVHIDCRRFKEFHRFFFNECEKETDLIVLSDFPPGKTMRLVHVIANEIQVDKKLHEPFLISPRIVVSCDVPAGVKLSLDASLARRFTHISLDSMGDYETLAACFFGHERSGKTQNP